MVPYTKDLSLIKAVGIAVSLIGVILLMLTLTSAVLALLTVKPTLTPTSTATPAYLGIVQFILAFGMSFSMIACGAELSHPEPLISGGLETLRLNWAALFGFMIAGWLLGFWLQPILGGLSIVIILLLLLIRPAVIRLS